MLPIESHLLRKRLLVFSYAPSLQLLLAYLFAVRPPKILRQIRLLLPFLFPINKCRSLRRASNGIHFEHSFRNRSRLSLHSNDVYLIERLELLLLFNSALFVQFGLSELKHVGILRSQKVTIRRQSHAWPLTAQSESQQANVRKEREHFATHSPHHRHSIFKYNNDITSCGFRPLVFPFHPVRRRRCMHFIYLITFRPFVHLGS